MAQRETSLSKMVLFWKKKNEEIVTMEEPKCDEALSPEDNSEDTIERSSLG